MTSAIDLARKLWTASDCTSSTVPSCFWKAPFAVGNASQGSVPVVSKVEINATRARDESMTSGFPSDVYVSTFVCGLFWGFSSCFIPPTYFSRVIDLGVIPFFI